MSSQHEKAHALITHFSNLYAYRYGKPPLVNRFKEKWGMIDMISDWGYDTTYDMLDYYFKTGSNHSLTHFYYNSKELLLAKIEADADANRRKVIREETKARAEQEAEELTTKQQ